jgi:hypothetical protein
MPTKGSWPQPLQGGIPKYGLDSPITTVVHDRGEKDYRKDFGTSSVENAPTPRELVSLEKLTTTLYRAMEDSFEGEAAFIPRKKLEEIMCLPQVLQIMPELRCFGGQDATEQRPVSTSDMLWRWLRTTLPQTLGCPSRNRSWRLH